MLYSGTFLCDLIHILHWMDIRYSTHDVIKYTSAVPKIVYPCMHTASLPFHFISCPQQQC